MMFTLEDREPLLLGDEPIWRDGVLAAGSRQGPTATRWAARWAWDT